MSWWSRSMIRRKLSDSEHDALMARCRKRQYGDLRQYPGRTEDGYSARLRSSLRARTPDHNRGAEADAVTALTVRDDALHTPYIPIRKAYPLAYRRYYYNRPRPCRTMRCCCTRCVRPCKWR